MLYGLLQNYTLTLLKKKNTQWGRTKLNQLMPQFKTSTIKNMTDEMGLKVSGIRLQKIWNFAWYISFVSLLNENSAML